VRLLMLTAAPNPALAIPLVHMRPPRACPGSPPLPTVTPLHVEDVLLVGAARAAIGVARIPTIQLSLRLALQPALLTTLCGRSMTLLRLLTRAARRLPEGVSELDVARRRGGANPCRGRRTPVVAEHAGQTARSGTASRTSQWGGSPADCLRGCVPRPAVGRANGALHLALWLTLHGSDCLGRQVGTAQARPVHVQQGCFGGGCGGKSGECGADCSAEAAALRPTGAGQHAGADGGDG